MLVEDELLDFRNATSGVTWDMVRDRGSELAQLLDLLRQEKRIEDSSDGQDPEAVLRLDHYHPHTHDDRYAISYHEHGVPPHEHEQPRKPTWLERWWARARGEAL